MIGLRLIVAVATIIVLVGCGNAAGPAAQSSLAGRTFLSTAVTQNGQPRELVEGTRVRLSFTEEELTGGAGCNTIGGGYAVTDGILEVGLLRMTQMACPEPLADQDRWLVELLESRPALALDGDELTLTTPTSSIILLDRTVADPDRPLVGTLWQVESLISRDAVSSVPGDAVATLTFNDDGTLSISAGCNTGRGRYVVDGDTVTVTELALTRMACDDARGELERAVLTVVQAPEVSVEIEAGSLTLRAGDDGLGLRAV